jgi:divalent metal cation (Fe/Co/Zn/Cd) transporter
MTERDADFARNLIAHLDRGADAIGPGTVHRLAEARAAALAALGAEAAGQAARAGRPAFGHHRGWVVATRWAAVALLVIGTGVGWQQWRRAQVVEQAHEYADLDTQILSSDLPIDALLDRGFQNWLNTSYEH